MRNKTREQLLIRVINLLDDAELGERHETIMNLVHSARRACREGQSSVAEQCRSEVLRHLHNARLSLQGTETEPAVTVVIDEAISQLDFASENTLSSPFRLNPEFTEPLCYLLIFTLLLTLVLHFAL